MTTHHKEAKKTLWPYDQMRAFAHLSAHDKHRWIADNLNDDEAEELKYLWEAWARDNQLMPPGDWVIWLILAGRGFGKTRMGAEAIRKIAESGKYPRIALVARTAADVRDVMIYGESGLMAISPPNFMPIHEGSRRRLVWPNGVQATTYSAEEPNSLRGPQHHAAWLDEGASWQYPQETFDQVMFGLRLGDNPIAIMTTTPRPIPLIKNLVKSKTTHVTSGTTFENSDNLAPTFFDQVVSRYIGTRLGRQELEGAIIDDSPNALWKREPMIEATRVVKPPELVRIVVALDPPANDNTDNMEVGAEAGIIVVGLGTDGHGYVLADYSMYGSPNEWALACLTAYNVFSADRIIGEINNGGDMIEAVIRNAAKDQGMEVSYSSVRATRGKQLRAEPVSAIYEQGRGHHVGMFPVLEDQQCTWEPGMKSPDRLDALVWGFTFLMVGKTYDGIPLLLYTEEEEKLAAKEREQKEEARKGREVLGIPMLIEDE